jgi:hypothetical protein
MHVTQPAPVDATVTSCFIDVAGPYPRMLVGRIYRVTGRDTRTFWVAESHDWDATEEETGGGYLPVNLGVFQDPTVAEEEIESRARGAQAPGTVSEPQSVIDALYDLLVAVVGEVPTISVQRGEDVTVIAYVSADTSVQAMDHWRSLRAAYPDMVVIRAEAGCRVRIRTTRTVVGRHAKMAVR